MIRSDSVLALDEAVLATILYFEVFDFPLKRDEIYRFLTVQSSQQEVDQALHHFVSERTINCYDGFYACKPVKEMALKRLESNNRAREMMPLARNMAKLIASFPFVTGVLLSGSISKDVMHEHSDIDYFIIVREGRLWVAKLFLKLYKKLFLANSKDHFCLNYFITEKSLSISERSIFTAIELATLVPVVGESHKEQILAANPWVTEILPNFSDSNALEHRVQQNALGQVVEKALGGRVGNRLNNLVQRRVRDRNHKKYAHLQSNADFDLMFRSSSSQSKVHTSNHHRRILQLYVEKLNAHSLTSNHVIL